MARWQKDKLITLALAPSTTYLRFSNSLISSFEYFVNFKQIIHRDIEEFATTPQIPQEVELNSQANAHILEGKNEFYISLNINNIFFTLVGITI